MATGVVDAEVARLMRVPDTRKTLHDWEIRNRLRGVRGVSEINSWGGHVEQIHVEADPTRLAAFGLTLADVHRALADNNLTFGGNYLACAAAIAVLFSCSTMTCARLT